MFGNSVRKKYLIWGGVFLTWVAVIVGTLWIKGYQYQSIRKVTDQEIIRITVYRALQTMEATSAGLAFDGLPEPDAILPYRDVDHFLEINPDCCSVSKRFKATHVNVSGRIIFRDKFGQIHFSERTSIINQYYPDRLYNML